MEKQLQELINKLRWMLSVLKLMEKQMLWDTPEHARYNVRKICDEEGLSASEKNLICACIFQESNYHVKAISKPNNDGTIDYGLCQYNNGKNKQGKAYWIGEGAAFRDIDEVLNDPEKGVRLMIKMYKLGKLNYWSSYSTGAYKRWMAQESRKGIPY
jgi:hypothetical protein